MGPYWSSYSHFIAVRILVLKFGCFYLQAKLDCDFKKAIHSEAKFGFGSIFGSYKWVSIDYNTCISLECIYDFLLATDSILCAFVPKDCDYEFQRKPWLPVVIQRWEGGVTKKKDRKRWQQFWKPPKQIVCGMCEVNTAVSYLSLWWDQNVNSTSRQSIPPHWQRRQRSIRY